MNAIDKRGVSGYYIPGLVFVICAYGFYLRLLTLFNHALWADELCQLDQMKGSFLDLVKGMSSSDFCSYLSGDHYLIYPFFKAFGCNKWGLAIPHIITTIAGFYILYLICKDYFKTVWGYIITFGIVSLNATLIVHSTEIRPYAVLPTLALAALYILEKAGRNNFIFSLPKRIIVSLLLIIIIGFHVYGILMFLTCFAFVLLSQDMGSGYKKYYKNAFYFLASILIFISPLWLLSVFGPHLAVPLQIVKTFDFIPNPIVNLAGFLKSVICNLIGSKLMYLSFLGILILVFFSYKDRAKQLVFLSVCVILPIIAILIFDLARQYWFLQRQFIWVMPLFAFFLGWAWDSLAIILGRFKKSHVI